MTVEKISGVDERRFHINLNYPEQITMASVQKLIASVNDEEEHSQIRVSKDGRAYIERVCWGEDRIEGVLFRSETMCAGNGYVGPEAAEDPEYVGEVYEHLKQLQKAYEAHKIDGRTARCKIPLAYEGPYL